MSLKSVKTKIRSIDKTRQVTKAMEAVSAVKMRKSQAVAITARPYATSAMHILKNVAGSIDAARHPLLQARDGGRTLLVIVSADKGLAGSYGSSLLKGVYHFLKEQELSQRNLELVTVGRKATDHFSKRGFEVIRSYERWSDGVNFTNVSPLAELINERFLKGEINRAYIAYTNFISTLNQEAVVRQLLPISFAEIERVIAGITPEHGRYAASAERESAITKEYTFEPSPDTVVGDLIQTLFHIQMFHSVLEANASEHSARMVAMKNASDNAGEISRGLKLAYNKARQAAITKEVSEIVGGMESMRTKD